MATLIGIRETRTELEAATMSFSCRNSGARVIQRLVLMLLAVLALVLPTAASAAEPKPKTFASPDEAVGALMEAVKVGDEKALLSIFGPDGKTLVNSGDPVQDRNGREWFLAAYQEKHALSGDGERRTLEVGGDDWPFPVPLVKAGDGWHFDTAEGKEELLNRRIGKNELNTIQVLLALVDAQREYASADRDGDGLLEYAQKFGSDKGKKNGLYWPTKEGDAASPLGSLVAEAVQEGYRKEGSKPVPYHGYHFKILRAQGKDAPGGAYSYLAKGKMIGGFAFLAYPAQYGSSGVMSFMVNHDGVVYQKDLGPDTAAAGKIDRFDPDQTWEKASGN